MKRVVAIDGPSGAGKSTVARGVAEALGLQVLDTGAMYRAVTLAALERGVDLDDGDACAQVASTSQVEVGDRVLLDRHRNRRLPRRRGEGVPERE